MKKIKIVLIFLMCISLLVGCSKDSYIIPKFVLDILEIDANEYSKDIKKEYIYDDKYEDVYANDGDLIFEINDEQIDELSDVYLQNLEYYKFVAEQRGMMFEYNDKFSSLEIKCSKEQFQTVITEKGVKIFVAGVAWSQALTGVKPEDLYVYGVVKDIETEEILYEYELYGR